MTDKEIDDMKKFGMFLLFIAAVFGFTWIVMLLWNWLIPEIIGWKAITYWQAMGLLALAKIFFGFGSGDKGGTRHKKRRRHRHWLHKFEHLTPEERKELCARWMGEKKAEDFTEFSGDSPEVQ